MTINRDAHKRIPSDSLPKQAGPRSFWGRRLCATAMAVVLVLGLCIVSFAEDAPENTTETISAEEGAALAQDGANHSSTTTIETTVNGDGSVTVTTTTTETWGSTDEEAPQETTGADAHDWAAASSKPGSTLPDEVKDALEAIASGTVTGLGTEGLEDGTYNKVDQTVTETGAQTVEGEQTTTGSATQQGGFTTSDSSSVSGSQTTTNTKDTVTDTKETEVTKETTESAGPVAVVTGDPEELDSSSWATEPSRDPASVNYGPGRDETFTGATSTAAANLVLPSAGVSLGMSKPEEKASVKLTLTSAQAADMKTDTVEELKNSLAQQLRSTDGEFLINIGSTSVGERKADGTIVWYENVDLKKTLSDSVAVSSQRVDGTLNLGTDQSNAANDDLLKKLKDTFKAQDGEFVIKVGRTPVADRHADGTITLREDIGHLADFLAEVKNNAGQVTGYQLKASAGVPKYTIEASAVEPGQASHALEPIVDNATTESLQKELEKAFANESGVYDIKVGGQVVGKHNADGTFTWDSSAVFSGTPLTDKNGYSLEASAVIPAHDTITNITVSSAFGTPSENATKNMLAKWENQIVQDDKNGFYKIQNDGRLIACDKDGNVTGQEAFVPSWTLNEYTNQLALTFAPYVADSAAASPFTQGELTSSTDENGITTYTWKLNDATSVEVRVEEGTWSPDKWADWSDPTTTVSSSDSDNGKVKVTVTTLTQDGTATRTDVASWQELYKISTTKEQIGETTIDRNITVAAQGGQITAQWTGVNVTESNLVFNPYTTTDDIQKLFDSQKGQKPNSDVKDHLVLANAYRGDADATPTQGAAVPEEGEESVYSGLLIQSTVAFVEKDGHSNNAWIRLVRTTDANGNPVERYVYCVDHGTGDNQGTSYEESDLEGHRPNNGAPLTADQAKVLNYIALHGYWATQGNDTDGNPKAGSVEFLQREVKEQLRAKNATLPADKRLSEDDIERIAGTLDAGIAIAATQAAIWRVTNGTEIDRDKSFTESWEKVHGNGSKPLDTEHHEAALALYDVLTKYVGKSGDELKDLEAPATKVSKDTITQVTLDVTKKATKEDYKAELDRYMAAQASSDAQETARPNVEDKLADQGYYRTDVKITMAMIKDGDSLTVVVYQDGKQIGSASTTDADKTLVYENGAYIIKNLVLATGLDINLELHGVQNLGMGAYLYESGTNASGNANSQDFMGMAADGSKQEYTLDLALKFDAAPGKAETSASGETHRTDMTWTESAEYVLDKMQEITSTKDKHKEVTVTATETWTEKTEHQESSERVEWKDSASNSYESAAPTPSNSVPTPTPSYSTPAPVPSFATSTPAPSATAPSSTEPSASVTPGPAESSAPTSTPTSETMAGEPEWPDESEEPTSETMAGEPEWPDESEEPTSDTMAGEPEWPDNVSMVDIPDWPNETPNHKETPELSAETEDMVQRTMHSVLQAPRARRAPKTDDEKDLDLLWQYMAAAGFTLLAGAMLYRSTQKKQGAGNSETN